MSKTLQFSKKVLGDEFAAAGEKDSRIVLLSADSGPNSGFGEFISRFPGRYYEFGIMEECVIGAACGFATTGLIPVFCAPAPFVTGHAYEAFRISIGYMQANVKLIGRNAGFSYSDLGPTHYALDDIGLVRLIPDVPILAPQDGNEMKNAFRAMMDYEGPVYMRVCNAGMSEICEDKPFVIGKGTVLFEGKDIAILSTGNTTAAAIHAAKKLREHGVKAMVVGMPTIWPLDIDLLKQAAKTERIITVEEHFTSGGFGSIVAEACAEHCPVPVTRIGVPNGYATSGAYEEMVAYYGLDSSGIAKTVQQTMKNKRATC